MTKPGIQNKEELIERLLNPKESALNENINEFIKSVTKTRGIRIREYKRKTE